MSKKNPFEDIFFRVSSFQLMFFDETLNIDQVALSNIILSGFLYFLSINQWISLELKTLFIFF